MNEDSETPDRQSVPWYRRVVDLASNVPTNSPVSSATVLASAITRSWEQSEPLTSPGSVRAALA